MLRGLTGEVYIDGRRTTIEHPRQAKSRDIGLALIPQDRQTQGLLLPMSIEDNLVLAASPDLSRFGLVDRAREQAATNDIVAKLRILANNLSAPVRTLSGGNQQKVVIGKWLLKQPRILLLNDPTRGIDVGTKQELYRLMRELAGTGLGILFYSTDYEELIGMCDRVLVCYGGRLIRELSGPDLNEHNLITTALNLSENNDHEGVATRGARLACEAGGVATRGARLACEADSVGTTDRPRSHNRNRSANNLRRRVIPAHSPVAP